MGIYRPPLRCEIPWRKKHPIWVCPLCNYVTSASKRALGKGWTRLTNGAVVHLAHAYPRNAAFVAHGKLLMQVRGCE